MKVFHKKTFFFKGWLPLSLSLGPGQRPRALALIPNHSPCPLINLQALCLPSIVLLSLAQFNLAQYHSLGPVQALVLAVGLVMAPFPIASPWYSPSPGNDLVPATPISFIGPRLSPSDHQQASIAPAPAMTESKLAKYHSLSALLLTHLWP